MCSGLFLVWGPSDDRCFCSPGGNELKDQVFRLDWAWISLDREYYVVDEDDAFLEVVLRRRGYLGETSFIGESFRGSSCLNDDHFLSATSWNLERERPSSDSLPLVEVKTLLDVTAIRARFSTPPPRGGVGATPPPRGVLGRRRGRWERGGLNRPAQA